MCRFRVLTCALISVASLLALQATLNQVIARATEIYNYMRRLYSRIRTPAPAVQIAAAALPKTSIIATAAPAIAEVQAETDEDAAVLPDG